MKGNMLYEGKELTRKYKIERRSVDVPDGCKYPDCFHCIFSDCGVDKIKGESTQIDDLIRSLGKVGWR